MKKLNILFSLITILGFSSVFAQGVKVTGGVNLLISPDTYFIISGTEGNINIVDGKVQLEGNLTVDGDIANSDSLIITSDASLLSYGTVTGKALVERALSGGQMHFIGMPVKASGAEVFTGGFAYAYDETHSVWTALTLADNLSALQGYSVQFVGENTVSFNDVLNHGAQSRALQLTGDGWNLMANPYPSAVHWDSAGWTKDDVEDNKFYIWNGTGYATYAGVTGTSVNRTPIRVNNANPVIPAMQGFFVKAKQTGTIGLSDAVRVHSTEAFRKSETVSPVQQIRLALTDGKTTDEAVLFFEDSYDGEISSEKRFSELETVPQLAINENGNQLVYNSYQTIPEVQTIPLFTRITEEGEYTIKTSDYDFSAGSIALEDTKTGKQINLSAGMEYSFFALASDRKDRFKLVISGVNGVDYNALSNTVMYEQEKAIVVKFSNAFTGNVIVLNSLGQQVYATNLSESKEFTTPAMKQAGTYLVKLQNGTQVETQKVIIN
jgi:hypothetical protein